MVVNFICTLFFFCSKVGGWPSHNRNMCVKFECVSLCMCVSNCFRESVTYIPISAVYSFYAVLISLLLALCFDLYLHVWYLTWLVIFKILIIKTFFFLGINAFISYYGVGWRLQKIMINLLVFLEVCYLLTLSRQWSREENNRGFDTSFRR